MLFKYWSCDDNTRNCQNAWKGSHNGNKPHWWWFFSNIFLRPKKDGSFRPIINLRWLNAFVAYHHFKMETIRTAIQLIRPNCFMASIDLKDAYLSVPIAKEYRIYLRFAWQNKVYEFTCLPFGLECAPRVFTKVKLQSHHPVPTTPLASPLDAGRANICCRPGHRVSAQDHRLAAALNAGQRRSPPCNATCRQPSPKL